MLIFAALALAAVATAYFLPFAFVVIAIAVIILSARIVDPLAVTMFWTLPYMIFNLPTGAFTLKLGEGVGYVFATAAVTRALLRRERWSMPPGTVGALVFLGVAWLSAACEPAVNTPFAGVASAFSRNSPTFRSPGELIWFSLSWLVVTATYNVVLRRPNLLPKCVAAHVLGGGIASIVSLGIFVLFFAFGINVSTVTGGAGKSSIAEGGSGFVRLAGVAYEPMYLAVYLLAVVPITLIVYLLKPDWVPRRLSGISLLLQFITLFLSFSAGGTLGIAIALTITFIALRKVPKPAKPMRNLKIGAAMLCVVAGLTTVAVSGILDKLISIANKLSDISGSNRHEEIVVGFNEFLHNPILGVGPGMTTYQFPKYSDQLQNQIAGNGTYDVHNIVVSVLGETGVLGFAALCFAMFFGLRQLVTRILKYGPERVPILVTLTATLCALSVQALSLDMGLLELMYVTGMLSLASAAYAVEHKASEIAPISSTTAPESTA